jgi:hypothetical protein
MPQVDARPLEQMRSGDQEESQKCEHDGPTAVSLKPYMRATPDRRTVANEHPRARLRPRRRAARLRRRRVFAQVVRRAHRRGTVLSFLVGGSVRATFTVGAARRKILPDRLSANCDCAQHPNSSWQTFTRGSEVRFRARWSCSRCCGRSIASHASATRTS